jgi:hypothetical protein
LLRHAALSMTGVLAGIALSGASIQAFAGAGDRAHQQAAAPVELTDSDDYGYVALVVDPWAEVYADGKLLAVTPTAERLRLRPGRHFLKFVHPHYGSTSREVTITRGKLEQVDVRLIENPPPKSAILGSPAEPARASKPAP